MDKDEKEDSTSPTNATPTTNATILTTDPNKNQTDASETIFPSYTESDTEENFRPKMTVEEIFAQGIAEWKRAREQVKAQRAQDGRTPSKLEQHPKTLRGPLYDPSYDVGFDQEVEAVLQQHPSARRRPFTSKGAGPGDTGSQETTEDTKTTSVANLGTWKNKRTDSGTTLSETEEPTADDVDHLYKMKMDHVCDIILDVFRILVVFVVSFLLTGLPWLLAKKDGKPEEFKLKLTEKNICYWYGSTSLLDENNPCPYRGYISKDMFGNDCLKWSTVMKNATWVEKLKKERNKEVKWLPRDLLKAIKQMRTLYNGTDFGTPFCRRLGDSKCGNTLSNLPVCFVNMDKEGKKRLSHPKISACWLVPCTVNISNQCYRSLWKNRENAEASKKPKATCPYNITGDK